MVDLALYALIGLFVLIPIEIFFLIILAVLKPKQPETPAPKRPERYGWEDHLKLPTDKSNGSNNVGIAIIIILFTLLLVALPTYFFVIPTLSTGNQSINDTANISLEINDTTTPDVNDSDTTTPDINESKSALNISNLGTNFSIDFLPSNLSLPKINLSSMTNKISPYKNYIFAVIGAGAILLAVLAIFIYFINRRKSAVIRKAKKTAEKLVVKPEKEKRKISFTRLKNVKRYIMPLIIFILLLVIAFLIYLARDIITAFDYANLVSAVKDFLVAYKFYIGGGVIVLIAVVILLKKFAKK